MTGVADDPKSPSVLPATLSLFVSASTLICCALPALLVSLGLGAVMAGLIEAAPQITWMGKHKALVFAGAGAMLAASGAWQWRARNAPCPADPAKARACAQLRVWSWRIWGFSVVLFVIGGFFAFFAAALIA
ncbi:MAG: hypothetical protein AAGC95_08580 [Pseudomonadota bacterium]